MKWEYENLSGKKKPDYLIPHTAGKCIVEVKEIQDPDPLPERSFEPDRPVRAKIRAARKQLKEYKHLLAASPCTANRCLRLTSQVSCWLPRLAPAISGQGATTAGSTRGRPV